MTISKPSNPEVCACPTCSSLLNEVQGGVLEIWYGSGSNGKTALLHELSRRVGRENTWTILPESSWLWLSTIGTQKLIIVQEPLFDDGGTFMTGLKMTMKPNIRYVMTVNKVFPWMKETDLCQITQFPHKFV